MADPRAWSGGLAHVLSVDATVRRCAWPWKGCVAGEGVCERKSLRGVCGAVTTRSRSRDGTERGSEKIEQRCMPSRRERVATTGLGHTQPRSWMIEARPSQGQGPTRRSMISRTGTPTAGVSPGQNTSCRGAAQVPIPLITPQIPDVARGDDGTTARCVAPKPRRSRRERACPRVGDGRPSNHMIR
jgi:hypothetical protein